MKADSRHVFFFYGTLMDGDVLAAVIGRPVHATHRQDAVLDHYRRVYSSGAWYPILVPMLGSSVDGVLVRGLNASEADRLATFEGDEYQLRELLVRVARSGCVQARVFMANPDVPASSETWTVEVWRRRHRREYLRRVRGDRRRNPRHR
jgi:gamma-glutamylcyclotransferase (GGCT)/AIG2-like uncharacterized protein YtfP